MKKDLTKEDWEKINYRAFHVISEAISKEVLEKAISVATVIPSDYWTNKDYNHGRVK